MANFQGGGNRGGGGFKGGHGGGKPSFQKKNWGTDRGSDRDTVMHKATCSECGKSCEVPFRPTGDKPVYCKDCFNAKRDHNDSRGGNRPDFGNRGPKKSFGDRPAFRSDSRPDFKPTQVPDNTSKQLGEINAKLDRLVGAIERLADTHKTKVPSVEKAPTKTVVKKATPKKKPVTKKKK